MASPQCSKQPHCPLKLAMAGISLLLEEEGGGVKQAPPGNCDPMNRQFLRVFHGVDQVPRDQMRRGS